MRFKRSYYSGLKTFHKVYALVVSLCTIPFCVAMFTFCPPLVQRDVHLVERTTRVTFLVWTNHPWLAFGLCKIWPEG